MENIDFTEIDEYLKNEKDLTEQEKIRIKKIPIYKKMGVLPFGQKIDRKNYSSELFSLTAKFSREEVKNKNIFASVAGRIMRMRSMGKIAFFDIKDIKGKIQCYISINNVSNDDFNLFKLSDLGDIVAVEGFLFYTDAGELTINISKYTHLSKAICPLPNKFFGLANVEEKQRKKYLEFITNDNNIKNLIARFKIIQAIRNFCNNLGFIEVETSILTSTVSGADARPFVTHHNSLNYDFYLRIATEIPLKKLIIGGLEKVYEIGKIFRNEGIDAMHNPEFTTIELYEAYSDLNDMRSFIEKLFKYISKTVFQKDVILFNNVKIDLKKPFEYISMVELIKKNTGIDFAKNITFNQAMDLAKKNNVLINKDVKSVGEIIMLFFEQFCEHKLIQPTFVHTYPIEVSPLAKKTHDERFAERFEFFINGIEIANAYSELNDPIDQKCRFQYQQQKKNNDNYEQYAIDDDFLTAMKYGMPPTGGLGIGLDRLIMVFCDEKNIKNVIAFPTVKLKKKTVKKKVSI
ncbi:MAG: lysine--tRNA ligase [Bacilli bacterium]|nr:lysine--tRNA ligase [Bacilli bacterium]